jgi:hypothetical protein
MVTRVLLGLGSVALACGVVLGGVVLFHVETARRGDRPPTEVTSPGDCPGARLRVTAPRVMSEGESGSLEVELAGDTAATCTWEVWVEAAAALDVRPARSQSVRLLPGRATATAHWILTPSRPGSWDVRIIADGLSETRRIKVTTILGLSPFAAALLSPILLVLGPMATLPYWIDRWRARRPGPP